MQHINEILSKLAHYTNECNDEYQNISHIPDTAWVQDNVEVLASMDAWMSEFSRQNSSSKESITKRIYEHMRRLRVMYGGLQYKELLHASKLAHKIKGLWAYNMIALLERRLDVVLWRALFSKSPNASRVMIKNGHILVNGQVCKKSSYILQPGDLISVNSKVVNLYQQNIIDQWSFITLPKGDKKYNSKDITPVSIIDIMTHALNHGNVIDILANKSYSLGCINFTTSNKQQNKTKVVPNIKSTALNVLSLIHDNPKFGQALWDQVYFGTHLEKAKENSSNYPYIACNIEVNYKTMSLIYLYTPQRVVWTSLVDMELLQNYLV